MKNDNSPAFRSSMSGFNKKDVTEYITKLNREFTDSLNERDGEIKSLKEKLKEAEEKLSEANESVNVEAAAELERANNLIAAQNTQLEELNRKIAQLEAELSEVNSKMETHSSKITQYESMTARMGEIFMEASADADRIRTEAREAASLLTANTESECEMRRAKLEAELTAISESKRAQMSLLLSDAQRDIAAVIESFGAKTRAVAAVSVSVSSDSADSGNNE